MTENTSPTFSKKCEILGDLWMNFRMDEQFADFVKYNDLGLPLAFAFSEELATPMSIAERYVDETYALLAEAMGLTDTKYYDTLLEMLEESENKE